MENYWCWVFVYELPNTFQKKMIWDSNGKAVTLCWNCNAFRPTAGKGGCYVCWVNLCIAPQIHGVIVDFGGWRKSLLLTENWRVTVKTLPIPTWMQLPGFYLAHLAAAGWRHHRPQTLPSTFPQTCLPIHLHGIRPTNKSTFCRAGGIHRKEYLIHAKSGWYLWYITANFFGFSAKF